MRSAVLQPWSLLVFLLLAVLWGRWVRGVSAKPVLLSAGILPGTAGGVVPEEELATLLREQMAVLEEKSGFRFDANWEPRFVFRVPDASELHPIVTPETFAAHYRPLDQSFVFHPRYRFTVAKMGGLVRHELSHALLDQISRRERGESFPPKDYLKLPKGQVIGFEMLSEGTAMYFQHLGEENGCASLDPPKEATHACWGSDPARVPVVYEGGCFAVRTILRVHCNKAIRYFLANPLVIGADRNVYAAVCAYQGKAIHELASMPGALWGPLTPPASEFPFPGIR